MSKSLKENYWPGLSLGLTFGIFNLILFILIGTYFNFFALLLAVILNVVIIPFLSVFFEMTGLKEKIWKFWKGKILKKVHIIISCIHLFWILFLGFKCLYPLLKNLFNDAKNSNKN